LGYYQCTETNSCPEQSPYLLDTPQLKRCYKDCEDTNGHPYSYAGKCYSSCDNGYIIDENFRKDHKNLIKCTYKDCKCDCKCNCQCKRDKSRHKRRNGTENNDLVIIYIKYLIKEDMIDEHIKRCCNRFNCQGC